MNFNEKDRDPRYWRALVIAEEMWEWLCDNPLKRKLDWPGYLTYGVEYMDYKCSMCEYIWQETGLKCMDCILGKGCQTCYNPWRTATDEKESQKYSFQIWKAIFKERLRIMELHMEAK